MRRSATDEPVLRAHRRLPEKAVGAQGGQAPAFEKHVAALETVHAQAADELAPGAGSWKLTAGWRVCTFGRESELFRPGSQPKVHTPTR